MFDQRLKELQKSRRNLGAAIFWYVVVAAPLLLMGILLSWGRAGATFLACLVAFYGAYHFWDGIKFYRWMLNEESRIRRAHALANQGVKQEGGE